MQELIPHILACQTLGQVERIVTGLGDRLGFENALYGVRMPNSFVEAVTIRIDNFPPEWMARYEERAYYRVDPVVAHCARSLIPLRWGRFLAAACEPAVVTLFDEAESYGIRAGLALGVGGSPTGERGMICLATGRPDEAIGEQVRRAEPQLLTLAPYIHETARRILLPQVFSEVDFNLTSRERECLLWVAEGKTSSELAELLNISEVTAIFHLKNALTKLGARSRAQAVARAVLLGILEPGWR